MLCMRSGPARCGRRALATLPRARRGPALKRGRSAAGPAERRAIRLIFTHRANLRNMALSHAVPSLSRAVPSGLGLA
ncbi:Secreted protein [Burkholderia ambifaria]